MERVQIKHKNIKRSIPSKKTAFVFSYKLKNPGKTTDSNIKKLGLVLLVVCYTILCYRQEYQNLTVYFNLFNTLKTHPTLTIEIQGHLCCTTHNEDVYDYLVENGISADRLSYKGFGGTRKIITEEESEEDKTTNRRVEKLNSPSLLLY